MATTLEQPKKPAGGGFGQFMAQRRADFIKKCQGQPITAVSKLAGVTWKAMSDAEKEPFNNAYEEAKKKFSTDMEAFVAAGGVKTKGATALRTEKRKAKEGKLKKKKDPNAPKKPAGGAFGCFLAANRAAFHKECGGPVTKISKIASERWKAATEDEKDKYNKQYEAKAAAYKEAMKSYVPPAGAEKDDEEDGDEEENDEEEEEEDAAPDESPAKKPKTDTKATVVATVATNTKATDDQGRPKAAAKGQAKAKDGDSTAPVIPATVQAQAEKAGVVEALTKLLARDDIKKAGIAAGKALSALQENRGLVHPTKRALLGA